MRARARLGVSALVAALVLTVLAVLGGPAQAATPWVKIDVIYYNPPGTDTGSNSHLNLEYIRLRNTDGIAHTLTGWTVRDPAGHVYKFPTTTIKANSTVTLRSGAGTDGISTRYWQQNWYVWNNTGDTAYLRSPSGTLVDDCSYGATAASYKTC